MSRGQLVEYIEEISQETASIPREDWHSAIDAQLARIAVNFAIERHVGKKERIVTREGETWVYYGKDLSETRTLIGTGGVFIYNSHVPDIFLPNTDEDTRTQPLRPKNPRSFVDSSYLLYAVGLLSQSRPDVGARIFQKHMKPVPISG